MRIALVVPIALFTLIVTASLAEAAPGGNGGTFPGQGNGVGGTPGQTAGTFPGGGATNGAFPGGGNTGGSVSASEPVSLLITGLGLAGAALLIRRRR